MNSEYQTPPPPPPFQTLIYVVFFINANKEAQMCHTCSLFNAFVISSLESVN